MTIGASIFLGALGAILRYAVADQVDNVDLRMIGLILMIAAAVGLVVGLIQMTTRRRIVTEVHDPRVPPPAGY
jgi:energy-converting hydrogenase Eha subunit C